VVYSFKVTGLLAKRLSARLVKEYVEDITPESELGKLRVRETFFISRDKGSGRPTKKERRTIDKLRGE
jgi:ribosome-associated heat shock protein Hsp15